MFVHPDLDIKLRIGEPHRHMWETDEEFAKLKPQKPRTAEVTDPPMALELLQRLQRGVKDVNEPTTILMGPSIKLTLPPAARKRAMIPEEADTYCFLYPARGADGAYATKLIKELVGAVSSMHTDKEPYLMFLLLGGFCYFDDAGRQLQVNSLSFASRDRASGSDHRSGVIYFDGPYEAPEATLAAMTDLERMQPITLDQFKDADILNLGWINSNEAGCLVDGANRRGASGGTSKGGAGEAPMMPWESGAFLCELTGGRAVYFKASAKPTTRRRSELGGLLLALTVLDESYKAAHEASLRLERDLAHFYRSSVSVWVGSFGRLIPTYFLVGVALYSLLEGWPLLDSLYFLVVTVTTVGYGDFCPQTTLGRLLTCFYAPLGTVVVMTGLHQPVRWVIMATLARLTMVANWVERLYLTVTSCECVRLWRALLCCGSQHLLALDHEDRYSLMAHAVTPDSSPTSASSRKLRLGVVGQYVHAVLGPLVFLAIGAVVGYFVHGWSVVDSLYWSVVSTTTVGYGDLLPENDAEKYFAIVFLPLATAALVSGANNFFRASLRISIIDTKYKLLSDQLLIKAANGEPGATLTREQFLLHVLAKQGLLDDEIKQAVDKEYDSMLAEYNDSDFARDEPRDVVDARTVYFHLKQQGRIVTNTFDAPEAKRFSSVEDGESQSVDHQYRVSNVKSKKGVDSQEAYNKWLQEHWVKAVKGEQATIQINTIARGKIVRDKVRGRVDAAAVMC